MTAVSLPNRVLGRKKNKLGAIFVKMYFGGAWDECYCPLYSLAMPNAYVNWTEEQQPFRVIFAP